MGSKQGQETHRPACTPPAIEEACSLIKRSSFPLVFTGAGVSSESGIPVFRGASGLWEKYSPALYGNIPGLALAFLLSGAHFPAFLRDALGAFAAAEPNPAHLALAQLERHGIIKAVVTQNIDNLHREAGTVKLVELHGNAFRLRCHRCGRRESIGKVELKAALAELAEGKPGRRAALRFLSALAKKCTCGSRMRPDVVLFGEALPRDALREAFQLSETCDCLIAAGTSALVYPAALIPETAVRHGAALIEINPVRTRLTGSSTVWVPLPASRAFREILRRLVPPGATGPQSY